MVAVVPAVRNAPQQPANQWAGSREQGAGVGWAAGGGEEEEQWMLLLCIYTAFYRFNTLTQ